MRFRLCHLILLIILSVEAHPALSTGNHGKKKGLEGHRSGNVSQGFHRAASKPAKNNWASHKARESRENRNIQHQFKRANYQSKAATQFNRSTNIKARRSEHFKGKAGSSRETTNHSNRESKINSRRKQSFKTSFAQASRRPVAYRTGRNRLQVGSKANHVFSARKRNEGKGKFKDSPWSRRIMEKVANGRLLGVDPHGKQWFLKTLPSGKQIYAYAENGIIKGGGYNLKPRDLIIEKGLKKARLKEFFNK